LKIPQNDMYKDGITST